ncbi:MAG: WXG100 family type VII secretion target [Butyrivibrio sp.]|nr:WXG100 family type VII secretion target [Butyrivibrio sp.]MBP3238608.1 WXG100 family type VII secretion target [Lachnospiraceae bacterium]
MASTNFYVNYGSFDDWAGKIAAKNDKLLTELKNINTHIKSLAGDYESNAAVTIREKIDGMVPRFEQYYDVVDNYAVFLRNAAAKWREAEGALNNNAQQFQ